MPEEGGGGGTISLALQSQIVDFLESSSQAWEKKNQPSIKQQLHTPSRRSDPRVPILWEAQVLQPLLKRLKEKRLPSSLLGFVVCVCYILLFLISSKHDARKFSSSLLLSALTAALV